MSSPNGDGSDAADRDAVEVDDADDSASTADAEWNDRHGRVESRSSERWVRAEPPGDDWQARHSRTKRGT